MQINTALVLKPLLEIVLMSLTIDFYEMKIDLENTVAKLQSVKLLVG